MKKDEFLKELNSRLSAQGEEGEHAIAYYREMLEDMIEDGMDEEEAIAELTAGGLPQAPGEGRLPAETDPREEVKLRQEEGEAPVRIQIFEEESLLSERDEQLDSMDISTIDDDIVFLPSEDGVLRVRLPEEEDSPYSCYVMNRTLSVRQNLKSHFSFSRGFFTGSGSSESVTIWLPHREFRQLVLKSTSGDFRFETRVSAGSFQVETLSGDIEVEENLYAENGKITSKSGDIEVGAEFGALFFQASTLSGDIGVSGKATFDRAQLSTKSGDIDFEGILTANALSLDSLSGDITLEEGVNAGTLRVKTVSGDIYAEALSVTGALDAGTVSGDMEFARVEAAESVFQTVSGEISVVSAPVDSVKTHTVSGYVDNHLRVVTGSGRKIETRTTSGNIELLPL